MMTDQATEYHTNMSSSDLDNLKQLLDYRDGFLASKTMFTACELGIFDLLHDAGEPLSAAGIASHLCTNVDATDRLLSACAGMKLLKVEMKNLEAYYSNTDLSSVHLVKSSPKSLYHMMMYYSSTVYTCWQFLPQAVRSEKELVAFMYYMESIWNMCGKEVIQAFDLSEFHTICDLGGCTGAFARFFLSTNQGATVTIMDLPMVVQTAKKYFVPDNSPQISFYEGDFFKDAIPEADLYILGRIIHAWTEEKCLQLLKRVYQSCRPGGAVLLIEVLLNEDRSGPLISQLFSLYMLIHSEGKERMPSEYKKLLTDAGFMDIQVRTTGKIYDTIMGRK
ncbi:acetylserotonin O-methyltransferase-like isoform X2 [Rana temporaria]|uniref:acetylserotonin O-methyltransferase-like isoform X2 n=1 Tax=Rana temporaria TaxID=8407 RepID=UPI001AAC6C46|nr:acetylserotonin O-methyltransferase-like isoform X2 [Rana temporaria]